jgi:hypothetical protein
MKIYDLIVRQTISLFNIFYLNYIFKYHNHAMLEDQKTMISKKFHQFIKNY